MTEDAGSPDRNPRRDALALRMLKSLELSQDERSLPTPRIRVDGKLVPPCSREHCRVCARHFLSSAARELLRNQNDYTTIDEENAKQHLQDLGRIIETHWLQLRDYSRQAVDEIPSLESDKVQELIDASFPGLLSARQLADIRYKRYLGVKKVLDINDGLKLPEFWTTMGDMEAGINFIVDMIKYRSDCHPGELVPVDNAELQLGWTSLLFQFTASDVFLNLSPASYSNAAISMPVEPSALHSSHIFTYERGVLILQRQKLLYQGLAGVVSKVCKDPAISACLSLPPVTIPSSADRSTLTKIHVEAASHVAHANSLLDTAQADLLEYINNREKNTEAMATIRKWLLDCGCPEDIIFGCTVSIHITDRVDHMQALHKLRQDLRRLQSAAKACLGRNESKTRLMEVREQLEWSVISLLRWMARSLIKQSKHFRRTPTMLWSHGNDYADLMRCSHDHLSNGPTRMIWQLFSLIELRAPVSDSIDVAMLEATNSEAQIRPGVLQEVMPWLELCDGVVGTLEAMCPCSGVVPKTPNAASMLMHMFTVPFDHSELRSIEDLWNAASVEQSQWAPILWEKSLHALEQYWEVSDLQHDQRRSLRHLFGMAGPPKKPRRRKSQARLQETIDNGSNDELSDAKEQSTAADALPRDTVRSKARRMHVQNHDPLAHLFHVNESLSKYGISEGFRWGTPDTPRPSQFPDDSMACSAQIKSAKRWQTVAVVEEEQDSPTEPGTPVELPAPEPIVFFDPELYDIWRQVFPRAGEGGSARSRIKWHDLRRVLVAEPLSMVEIRVVGIECKWRRPALHGYEERTITMHQPHGLNGWLEKTYLFTIRGAFRHVFGWDAESFALEA